MKRMLTGLFVCGFTVALVAGCVSTGPKVSDQDLITDLVNQLKVALESKDIDGIMNTFSDDFYHPEVGGKEEGKEMLQMALDAGYADNGEVNLDDMEIDIKDDGTASVYPIDLSADPGSISIELVVKKEEAGWRILEVLPDGI
jgi:ketosteroid isomerase-like protein